MRANSPSSIAVSLSIHVFVAAVIFVTTVYVAQQEKLPVIFELVAGPPTAPEQLVAPALGNTTAPVKLEVPKAELTPEKPVVAEVAKPVEPEVRPAPKPDTSIAKQLKKKEDSAYQRFLRAHPTPKPAAPVPNQKVTNVPRIDAQGIANGVRGGSTTNTKGGGGGKALTREEQSELNTYISFLLNALKEAHEPPPGVSDQLEAKVTFDITASGAILNPRISKSSGNREFDESVLQAFRKVRSIGPTPNGKADTWTVGFKMKDEG